MTYITEAVFAQGRKTMKPVEACFQKCKDELEQELAVDGEFNPEAYWRKDCWKKLEDTIQKTFGFRSVSVMTWNEKYDKKSGMFETKDMSVELSYHRRYPIEGLVTDKGFYDKSHSLVFTVYLSLGTVKALSAAELTACTLHEFGHAVDPALMDIHYAETNALAKYMTDRQTELTDAEKKAVGKKGLIGIIIIGAVVGIGMGIGAVLKKLGNAIGRKWANQYRKDHPSIGTKRMIQKIQNRLEKEASLDRRTNEEAYADDFARMYGYGPQLASSLMKIYGNSERQMKSRIELEVDRQKAIAQMFLTVLDDTHKTDVQRINALIREYHNDIKDPKTPPAVKKQLQEDVKELEEVLDDYLNHFDDFTNRINKMIAEAVDIKELADAGGEEEEDLEESTEPITEAAKHPIRQRINQFKQKYHYREEEIVDVGKKVLAGTIIVHGQKFVLINNDEEPVTLQDVNNLGKEGDFVVANHKPYPLLHLSIETLTEMSPKERDATILHEVGHFKQKANGDIKGPLTIARAQQDDIDVEAIHGKGLNEIDADAYAAKHSKDKDALMKALRKDYRNNGRKRSMKKELTSVYQNLPGQEAERVVRKHGKKVLDRSKNEQLKIQKMMDAEIEKVRKEYEALAAEGDQDAAKALRSKLDRDNRILIAAAKNVAYEYWQASGEADILTVDEVLWNTHKYRSHVYRDTHKFYDPGPKGDNQDFQERLKAHQHVKANGGKNPYTITKDDTIRFDELIPMFQNDINIIIRDTIKDAGPFAHLQDQVVPKMRELLKDLPPIRKQYVNSNSRLRTLKYKFSDLCRNTIWYLINVESYHKAQNNLQDTENRLAEAKKNNDPEEIEDAEWWIDMYKRDVERSKPNVDDSLEKIQSIKSEMQMFISASFKESLDYAGMMDEFGEQ